MWNHIDDVPGGTYVIRIENPMGDGRIWAEVILNSPIPSVIVYACDKADLENIIFVSNEEEGKIRVNNFIKGLKCPLCNTPNVNGISMSIQYNHGDWYTFKNVCFECKTSIGVEVADDNKNITGFMVNYEN